jgi:micrococcal nuclease
MNSRIWLSVVVLFLYLLVGCSAPPETAKVIQVIDGDTITVEGGYRVRYIGIDTPETHPVPEAFSETDKYGRLLRYVYVDDVFVNAELVRQGLAEAKAYPPDIKYQDYLEEMEAEARKAGRGMWAK